MERQICCVLGTVAFWTPLETPGEVQLPTVHLPQQELEPLPGLADGVSGHCVFQQHAESLGETDSWMLGPLREESSESSGNLGAPARSRKTAGVSLVGVALPCRTS